MKSKVPQLGQFVRVLNGRDIGKFAIIIKLLDDRFVFIADGDRRKYDQPKKKNIAHLEYFPEVSTVVTGSIQETGRVTNGKLRYALGKFTDRHRIEAEEKGE